jgi:hypothetical protein
VSRNASAVALDGELVTNDAFPFVVKIRAVFKPEQYLDPRFARACHPDTEIPHRRFCWLFGSGSGGGTAEPAVDVKSLHAKIDELTLENDFLEGALTKAGLLSAKR